MSAVWPQLILVGVLVLLNAFFAGSELALVSLREGQLQRLQQRSATGAVLARLARDPNRFFATIQICAVGHSATRRTYFIGNSLTWDASPPQIKWLADAGLTDELTERSRPLNTTTGTSALR